MKTAFETNAGNVLRQALREIPLETLLGLRFGASDAQEEVYRQCFRPVSLAIRRAFGSQRRLDLDAVVASAFRTYFRYPVVSRKEPGELHGDWGALTGHIIRTANNKALRDLRVLGRETPMSTIGGDEDRGDGGPVVLEPVVNDATPFDELARGEDQDDFGVAARAIASAKTSVKDALRQAAEPEIAELKSAEDRSHFHRHYGASLGLSSDSPEAGANAEPSPSKEALKKRGQRQAHRIKARLLRLLRRPTAPEPATSPVPATSAREGALRAALTQRIAEIVEAIATGLSPQDLVIYCGALDQAPSGQIAAALPDGRSLSPDLIRKREVPRVLKEVDAILKHFTAQGTDAMEAPHARVAF